MRGLDGCDLFLGLLVFFRGSLLLPAAAAAVAVCILSFFLLDLLCRPFSSLDLDRSLDLLLILREALLDRSLLEAPLLDRWRLLDPLRLLPVLPRERDRRVVGATGGGGAGVDDPNNLQNDLPNLPGMDLPRLITLGCSCSGRMEADRPLVDGLGCRCIG